MHPDFAPVWALRSTPDTLLDGLPHVVTCRQRLRSAYRINHAAVPRYPAERTPCLRFRSAASRVHAFV